LTIKKPDVETWKLIHDKGKLLFGTQYDPQDMERRVVKWRASRPDMTIGGIWYTIRWWYDICGHGIEDSNGSFGIVPFVYDDAKAYCIENHERQKEHCTQEVLDRMHSPETDRYPVKVPEFKPKNYFKGYELS